MKTGIFAVVLLGAASVQAAAIASYKNPFPNKNMCHHAGEPCTKLRRAVNVAVEAIDPRSQIAHAKRAALALAEAAANALNAYDPSAESCYATNGTCNVEKGLEIGDVEEELQGDASEGIISQDDVEKRSYKNPFPNKNMCHHAGEPCTKLKRAAQEVAETIAEPKDAGLCDEDDEVCENAKRSVEQLSSLAEEFSL